MRVRFIDADGAHDRPSDDVVVLLGRDDGFLWVDVPHWDDETEGFLHGLGCHPKVIEACTVRNHVPTVHSYPDHWFLTMHTPLLGEAGHVHLLELDLIVGEHYLVTVHGPLNPIVDPAHALVETDGVLHRIEEGRFRPTSPADVAYAVASGVARSQRDLVRDVAERLPGLEQQVMQSQLTEPEALLEKMFLIRHELITARTMAAQTHDVCARIGALDRWVPEASRALARDLADQFDRVRSVADGESHFLFGVIELYQTKVNTKMTVAMERLAVIAAVTLPVTAIASVYGMNVIVNEHTHVTQLLLVLVTMVTISGLLLIWAKRQGWW
ncbi:magnesium transporter CorA family protein [Nocardioides iriomotensis]|uniref:Magnesium transporter n=1 Tax=Nocardioides iriomotensis TaxID=715784 RepID=A0A4Q5IT12_9ACTN|nr:magnesium transporter CorA family protein [Nocardioides iriomotensis]RYU08813.1 magnesium transporter [Nocardioides iriomotensis]